MSGASGLGPVDPTPLPGMAEASPTSGEIVAGVRRTIAQLVAEDRVTELHAGKLALALAMAEVVETKRRGGRGLSTVGMDARVLLDVLDGLQESAEGVDDELRATMAEWREQVVEIEQSRETTRP